MMDEDKLSSERLTPMERALLHYVERLTSALEQSASQFEALEQRSTGLIAERQRLLSDCMMSLIASQASFMTGFRAFAKRSGGSALIPPEMEEAFRLLETAGEAMTAMPSK